MEKSRYDVFLSHATSDKPAVEELARTLKKRGFEPWLDKWNLIPGEPWQEAIEKALEDCTACAVCIGPSGTGPWQNEEMRAAIDRRVSDRSRQFRVIPVLLPRAERGEPSRLPAFLRATTWVEFRETLDDEKALHRLDCGIRGIPPGSDPGEAVAEGACPYRGLQVFDVGDALFFFGREALTGWLLDKLRTDRTGNRFLAIVGPSGSGKSSLARAGLIANLKRGEIPGSDAWPVAICKPGAQPLESLAVTLANAARLGDSPSALRDLIRDLDADPRMLHLTSRLSLRDAPADRRLVVFVDQFEEIFTLCPDEAHRKAIIANLLHAATAADGQTVVVVTLRADFYGRCAAYPDLAAAVSDRQSLVGPMTRDELRSAVERPAYLTGCELEGGLADLLLNEVAAQPGSLPLLEHALLQIWQRREGGRRLTVAAYHEIGGVAGALEKHAEEVYAGFSEAEKETCRRVFLRLVQVDEQGRATKRRLSLDELAPGTAEDSKAAETVVARLIDARLLTSDQEKRPTVELAHEALLNNWDRLKQWIEQDREALRTRRRLDEAVAEWLGKNRDPSFLLEGGRLTQVEEWAAGHSGEIGPEGREFLTASVAERDRERQRELAQAKTLEEEQRRRADAEHQRAEEQVRARHRSRKWTIISLIAAALALIAAVSTAYLWRVADQRRKIDLAGELAEKARRALRKDPALGLLLSIKAVRLAASGGQPHLPPSEEALREILASFRGRPFSTGRIRYASVSSDRRWLVTANADGSISSWSLTNRGPSKSITAESQSALVQGIAAGPEGSFLLADLEGISLVRPNQKNRQTKNVYLKGEDWLIGSNPFSPGGRWLLTRRTNDAWILRRIADISKIVVALKINPTALSFSPNDRWLAVVGPEALQIWDLGAPNPVPRFQTPNTGGAKTLTFSSDSQWIVAAGAAEKHTFQAWKVSPGQEPGSSVRFDFSSCTWSSPVAPSIEDPFLFSQIPDFASCFYLVQQGFASARISLGPYTAAAIDPEGNRFAVGDVAGSIHIGSLNPRRVNFRPEQFQAGPAQILAFQGRRLISQGGADPPRILEVLPRLLSIAGIEPRISSSVPDSWAISPKGWRLSFSPKDRQARLWRTADVQPFMATAQALSPWIFSPDGNWLAAAGENGRPLLWSIGEDGTPSTPIIFSSRFHHSTKVSVLVFSPDDRWLASGDKGGESRLWDLRHPEAEPHALTNSAGGVNALAFSFDSHLIAQAAKNGQVRLRGIDDGPAAVDRPGPPEGHIDRGHQVRGPITSLAFLPDGRLALGGSSSQIHLWGPADHDTFLDCDLNGTMGLVVNLQGDRLAGISPTGEVQAWSLQGRNFSREPFHLNGDPVRSIAFTSDGQGLWSLGQNGSLTRWELSTDQLLNLACKAVGRNLTAREWREHIPSETYQEREPCPEFPRAYD